MLGARSAGMTLNRIIDAKIDAHNPRTSAREIPMGKISLPKAYIFTAVSLVILISSAFQLPRLCQLLLPIPVIWVWVYPYLKRFTWLCHFFLGTTLGGATLGGWIAVVGGIETMAPVYLSLAVCFWVSGFDIIYALQDYEFDIEHKIHSIPAKFGIQKALYIARACHLLTPLFLYFTAEALRLGIYFRLGILAVVVILCYEQKIVSRIRYSVPTVGERIEKAFFTLNSWISVLILCFVIMEIIF